MSIGECKLELSNQEQLVQHGSLDFPVTAYCTDVKNKWLGELNWHWHKDMEVLIVKQGRALLKIQDSVIPLGEGEGAFLNSNTLHSIENINESDCLLHSLVFHSSLISSGMESIFEQKYIRPLINSNLSVVAFSRQEDWQSRILEAIEGAYLAYESGDSGYEWLIRENLSRIWFLIFNAYEAEIKQIRIESQDSERIKTLIQYVQQHYAKHLTIQMIADSANISVRECQRCFKNVIGISPIQYLSQYRLTIAVKLLCETDQDITEICYESGFQSPSYFTKKFKEQFGLPPLEYRKQFHDPTSNPSTLQNQENPQ